MYIHKVKVTMLMSPI